MKKSQVFQSVVVVAITLVLVFSMTAIGSVAESNDGYKIDMGTDGNESNKGLLSGGNDNDGGTDTNRDLQSNELTDAVQETNGVQREDAESISENGDVSNYTDEFGEVSGGASMQKNTETVRTEQLSEKTYESVNQAPVLNSDSDSEYFRNKGISKFTETGMVRSSDSELQDVTGVTNGRSGGSVDSITLADESSTVPVPQTPESNAQQTASGVEVTGGANGDEYAFKRASDGTVHVTTKDGKPTSLPAGTELNVQTTEMSSAGSREVTYTSPPESLNSKAKAQTEAIIESENAETNTEKSRAISDWLKENKEYRADSTYTSDDEISSFITEKNGGSAEEFAMAHTAMSREAGVPSRVATGYKKPSRESETTRAMDKHAWSETRTENGNWVTVDPTPSERDEELQQVRNGNPSDTTMGLDESVVEEVASTQPNAREVSSETSSGTQSSIGEQSGGENDAQQPVGEDSGSESSEDESPSRDTPEQVTASPPYDIAVSPDPIPGKRITITVTGSEGTPASGIGVVVNNKLVGIADSQGQVQITTPYTTRLEITTKQPDASEVTGRFAVPKQASDSAQRVFELPVDVNTSTGVVLPGEQATITAMISDTPIAGAGIAINGESVGTANANGELTTTLPNDVATGETVAVTVTRGGIRGEDTIQLAEPQLKADSGIAPLPFTEATFTSIKQKNGETKPVTGTEITVRDGNGDVVTSSTVNSDGVVNASIPVTSSITGSAGVSGVETTASITGIYYWIGGVGVVFGGVVIVAGRAVYMRRDVIIQGLGKIKQVIVSYNKVLRKIQTELRNIRERVVSLLVSIVEYGAEKKTRVIAHLRGVGVKTFIVEKIRALFAWLVKNTPVGGSENSDVQFTSNTSRGAEQRDGEHSKAAETIIREYWGRVVQFTIRRASQTSKTTVEIKNKAVNMGLPEKHTARIQRAFTDIEYGKKTGESRLPDASESAEELQNTSDINIKE